MKEKRPSRLDKAMEWAEKIGKLMEIMIMDILTPVLILPLVTFMVILHIIYMLTHLL